MSDLQILTENDAGNSWVDPTPGPVSSSYQAQNTNIAAGRLGIDELQFSINQAEQLAWEPGGIIDENGLPFVVPAAGTKNLNAGGNIQYILIVDGAGPNERDFGLMEIRPEWDKAKNGWYSISGKRVSNTFILKDSNGITLAKLTTPGGVPAGADTRPEGLNAFPRNEEMAHTTWDVSYNNLAAPDGVPAVDVAWTGADLLSFYNPASGQVKVTRFAGRSDDAAAAQTLTLSLPSGAVSGLSITWGAGDMYILTDNGRLLRYDGFSAVLSNNYSMSPVGLASVAWDDGGQRIIGAQTPGSTVYYYLSGDPETIFDSVNFPDAGGRDRIAVWRGNLLKGNPGNTETICYRGFLSGTTDFRKVYPLVVGGMNGFCLAGEQLAVALTQAPTILINGGN